MPCFVHFFRFRQCKNYWNRLRFDSVAVKCTLLRYINHGKKSFWFFQVRWAHRSGDVINFIIVACRIYSRLEWYKNYKNRLRLARVIVKNKMSRFYGSVCSIIYSRWVIVSAESAWVIAWLLDDHIWLHFSETLQVACYSWAPAGMGKGALAPWKCKVFCALAVTVKRCWAGRFGGSEWFI